jgi:hypothetical protein
VNGVLVVAREVKAVLLLVVAAKVEKRPRWK